jgi:type IV secretion system protein VirB9
LSRIARQLRDAALAFLLLSAPALAQDAQPTADPRIRSVRYDPDRVVALSGYVDYQTMIEFGAGERIENVSIGDAQSWQVTPNRAATLLFVKPVENAAATNMTVVTNRRRYAFALTADGPPRWRTRDPTFVLRFEYPPEAPNPAAAPRPAPQRRNADYVFTGSRNALPAVVFDDGASTYFQLPEGAAAPAVFILDERNRESIANVAYRDGYLVVEQLASRFRLRNGADVVTIVNRGWRAPQASGQTPLPADARTARQSQQGAQSNVPRRRCARRQT